MSRDVMVDINKLTRMIKYETKTEAKRKRNQQIVKSLWMKPKKGRRKGFWHNVAKGKPVKSSGHIRRREPKFATDGNPHTYTLSRIGKNQWISVDLQKYYHVGWVSIFLVKPYVKYMRGFTVFAHDKKKGWRICGLNRNIYFSTKPKYVIIDCAPDTIANTILVLKKGRGMLSMREIHVQAWI